MRDSVLLIPATSRSAVCGTRRARFTRICRWRMSPLRGGLNECQNQPLYIAAEPASEALKLHFLVHSSLDIVEEKRLPVGPRDVPHSRRQWPPRRKHRRPHIWGCSTSPRTSACLAAACHTAVPPRRSFGQLSGTKEKFIVVLEVGSPKEAEIKLVCVRLWSTTLRQAGVSGHSRRVHQHCAEPLLPDRRRHHLPVRRADCHIHSLTYTASLTWRCGRSWRRRCRARRRSRHGRAERWSRVHVQCLSWLQRRSWRGSTRKEPSTAHSTRGTAGSTCRCNTVTACRHAESPAA